MNNPQPLEPPRKKVDRPQIAFNLNADEAKLKDAFVKLVGGRGTKPILVEFMRRYVEHGGKISTVGASDDTQKQEQPERNPDPLTATRSSEERSLVAAFLLLLRDRSELARGPREAICTLLEFWLKKLPGYQHNNGKKSA